MKPPARLHPPETREAAAVSRAVADTTGASGAVDVPANGSPVDDATRSLSQTRVVDEPRTRPLLPPAYRGRTSGEFVRPIVPGAAIPSAAVPQPGWPAPAPAQTAKSSVPELRTSQLERPNDTATLLILAEQQVAALGAKDERRRLLELGILRRDWSLLRGLLQPLDDKHSTNR